MLARSGKQTPNHSTTLVMCVCHMFAIALGLPSIFVLGLASRYILLAWHHKPILASPKSSS